MFILFEDAYKKERGKAHDNFLAAAVFCAKKVMMMMMMMTTLTRALPTHNAER
jgi:hypothetical protein